MGRSGSGKSTLLKLLMRFWQAERGEIRISDRPIQNVNTENLRNLESYVTQETYLFHDTIANNLRIAKLDAAQAELEAACRKASVHDFIASLPQGYDTPVAELGDSCPVESVSDWGLPGHFYTRRRFCCWMSPPAILTV